MVHGPHGMQVRLLKEQAARCQLQEDQGDRVNFLIYRLLALGLF